VNFRTDINIKKNDMTKYNIFFLIVIITSSVKGQWVQASGAEGRGVFAFVSYMSVIFAGTNNCLFLSTDGGSSWAATTLTDNTIYALTAKGNDLIVGTFGEGILLSSDSGASWTSINTGLPTPPHSVSALYCNDDDLFAGIGDEIYLSENGGLNWNMAYHSADFPHI
jgi:photosystem II stability/assembly factor-like uncharacterized protein